MNDYSRCAEACQEAIHAIESVDGIDPDIQYLIDEASFAMSKAQTFATERAGETV